MTMKNALIALIVLVVLGGAAALLFANNKDDTTTNTTPSTSTTPAPSNTSTPTADAEKTAILTYTDSGFSPSTVTVKAGGQVTVKNNSSSAIEVASDPHPVHTENPELNQDQLAAGESQTFTVTKTGTFGIHNHLDSSKTANITVQ
jgi:plastocyanin